VACLCGDEGFERLARAYLQRHPSRHWSLNVLGRHMGEFLAGPVRVPRRALLADVARLEASMSAVFDAPASAALGPADFARVPAEQWANARPRLVDALAIHAFDHRANALVTAVRQKTPLPDLGRKKTWVAVYRKDFVVWRMDLTAPMHAALAAVARGASLREAIESGASVFRGPPDELERDVARWFGEWASEGFFAEIRA
jgi:hypothetical protein